MKIALIGMPAAGKTSLGRKLAEKLGTEFADVDQRIQERIGCTIREYFASQGESAFRLVEAQLLTELIAQKGHAVISTGGGVILSDANRAILRSRCMVLYLHANVETLLKRVVKDRTRPLLQDCDPLARLQELYVKRHVLYEETADLQVSIQGLSFPALLAQVHALLLAHGWRR